MTPTPPPRRRTARPSAAPAAQALRTSRPETVPAGRAVSRGPRLARVGVWAALAAGPLALAVAVGIPRTTVAQAAPAHRPAEAVRPPADPRGIAELFVDLWLRADAAVPDSAAAAALRSLAPGVELPKRPRSTGTASAPARVVAVRTADGPGGTWTVMVAAVRDQSEPAPAASGPGTVPQVRYFAVSGTGGKDGGPVTVGGGPAEVAAPDAPPVPASEFNRPVPAGSALGTSLGEFVRTYLGGGQGAGLERYLSPGLRVAAPKAAPYARVEVEDVAADAEVAAGQAVPADGARARVRIRVTGEDAQGVRWPLLYRAEVTARAGRWEVSVLEAGVTGPPAVTPAPAPTATGTATALTGGAR
ncbi:conjugal transfer protein [Streptomyces sp. NBC_00868]|uniref:conjugal transfer protein n=1 Tax=unclassified Streptomyces TaxID=2593676 RepID=UPI003247E50D|nr:conjugal transfer protein [Streptomyces sp. NBC_00868]